MKDPRLYQIAALSLLLLYGITHLGFDITPARVALLIGTALATQWLASRFAHLRFDPKSALISALSLCLLLRSNSIWVLVAGAVIPLGGKFVIRIRGQHRFNPTDGATSRPKPLTRDPRAPP